MTVSPLRAVAGRHPPRRPHVCVASRTHWRAGCGCHGHEPHAADRTPAGEPVRLPAGAAHTGLRRVLPDRGLPRRAGSQRAAADPGCELRAGRLDRPASLGRLPADLRLHYGALGMTSPADATRIEPYDYGPSVPAGRRPGSASRSRWSAVDRATIATGVAILLATSIRAFLVLSRDFPLNDGALFYLMSQELGANGFSLPATTAYNGAGIPFAYSPLGFYLAAALHAVLGVELAELFRFLPLLFGSLCVVAFALIGRELIPSRPTLVAALCTFAVLPRSFLWLIMGGGLTRSLGFFFAILALWQIHRAYTRQTWRHVAWATVCSALTVLSHLGTAPFVAFSAGLMFLFFGRQRFGVYASLAIGIGTAALTAPWWGSVAATHGFAPFIAADATGGTVFGTHTRSESLTKLAYFGLGTAEPLFPIIGALAIIGVMATITRRGAFLPLWWLATTLLDTPAGATYASITVALLAGIALTQVIVPIVARPPSWIASVPRAVTGNGWDVLTSAPRHRQVAVGVVLTVFLGYGIASAVLRRPSLNAEGRFLTSLTADDRAAMSWVARSTSPDSRFVIVVGGAAGGWWADRVGEWFPVLANRVSVATVQGTEWLREGTFEQRERQHNELQGCAIWSADCVEGWARTHGIAYSHIYIPKTLAFPCCAPLEAALRNDAGLGVVFDGPGATIYERLPLIVENAGLASGGRHRVSLPVGGS